MKSGLHDLHGNMDRLAKAQPRFSFDTASVTLQELVRLALPPDPQGGAGQHTKQLISRSRKADRTVQMPMFTVRRVRVVLAVCPLLARAPDTSRMDCVGVCISKMMMYEGSKREGVTTPPLRGVHPTPGHRPPDSKCQLQCIGNRQ